MLEVLVQCGNGVLHLHKGGLCHRDIRCANFLVASTQPLKVQISDFGLSHALPQSGSGSTYNTVGPIGTCVFLSVCVYTTCVFLFAYVFVVDAWV